MKIIGGKYKGRNFFMPQDIRPTQNIVRKAVFDILGQDLDGVKFLELFAGSGAMGLEAISRGADQICFVEKDPTTFEAIEESLRLLHVEAKANGVLPYELLNLDAFAAIKYLFGQKKKYDVVFVDPPYGRELAKKALNCLAGYDILHPNCVLIFQHEKREILPEAEGRFFLFSHRKYGATHLSLYRGNS